MHAVFPVRLYNTLKYGIGTDTLYKLDTNREVHTTIQYLYSAHSKKKKIYNYLLIL